MKLRSFALVLALLYVAAPVLGVVCEMDCDQPPTAAACHESTAPDGPTMRGARHACDHDHTTGSPALLAGPSARDSIGTVIAVAVPALAYASVSDARLTTAAAMHGPPGLIGRSTSSRITVLRI